MGDGVAQGHDERLAVRPPFYVSQGFRESLASERVSKTEVIEDQPVNFERRLDGLGNEWLEDVRETPEAPKEPRTPRAPRPKSEPREKPGLRTEQVDLFIRSKGYTGPINKQMRDLARDVISHNASLAEYAKGL